MIFFYILTSLLLCQLILLMLKFLCVLGNVVKNTIEYPMEHLVKRKIENSTLK